MSDTAQVEVNQCKPLSCGIRPSVLSTCSILPVPFLNDNYAYLLAGAFTPPLFQLIISTFCGIRWVHDFPLVY